MDSSVPASVRTQKVRTSDEPGVWSARAADLGLRDFCFLARRFLGTEMWLCDPEVVARVEGLTSSTGADAVASLMQKIDSAWLGLPVDSQGIAQGAALLLLGYEAAVSLDGHAPMHDHDPSLGPNAELRIYRSGLRLTADGVEAFYPGGGAPSPSLLRMLESFAETPSWRRVDGGRAGEVGALHWEISPGAKKRHEARVEACREALFAGALYQANLAHRLCVDAADHSESAWQFAARVAPHMPPFSAFWDTASFGSLVSLSPECFFSFDLANRSAKAFPIKGTRPRGKTLAEDQAERTALLQSEKDAAEHVMIVDLLRNDLGRVAEAAGVSVEQLLDVVSVSNVHHLESTVTAILRPDVELSDLVRALAPGGSITGAPKSAALEWIHRLEDGPRGPYTGTILACDGRGRGAASILIRTWIRPDSGAGALHVGGGVVVDSQPAAEWEETLQKARAFSPSRRHVAEG